MMSIKTSMPGYSASVRWPGGVLGVYHLHARALQDAGEGEDVAHVVIDDQHLPASTASV